MLVVAAAPHRSCRRRIPPPRPQFRPCCCNCLLPAACCLPPAACCLLPAACCLLLLPATAAATATTATATATCVCCSQLLAAVRCLSVNTAAAATASQLPRCHRRSCRPPAAATAAAAAAAAAAAPLTFYLAGHFRERSVPGSASAAEGKLLLLLCWSVGRRLRRAPPIAAFPSPQQAQSSGHVAHRGKSDGYRAVCTASRLSSRRKKLKTEPASSFSLP